MTASYSTELYGAYDHRELAEEQAFPEALRRTSFLMKALCFIALGRPDLEDHWKSLQLDEKFETIRTTLCSILANTITTAVVLLATSGVFVTTVSPVTYFDYSSPAPYFLLLMSLMLAMIAMLISGLNMIRWLHTDRQWTQEQLKQGGYFVVSYLLSLVTPIFFVASSLHCFMFAMLLTGFFSQSIICRTLTAFWVVTYVANIGIIWMEFLWKYANILKAR